MNFKFNYYWLLVLVPCLFIFWYFRSEHENKPSHYLPYFGPKNALRVNDTTYHFVPPFAFISQDSTVFNSEQLNNKIYVAEFFFTTCKSICPMMNTNLERVYKEYKNDPDFMILSHTVDPEIDGPSQLARYAQAHGVNDKAWIFVTGSKKKLYEIARKGYILNAEEGDGGDEDFIHTQNFALVDKDKHIRGFYDGTDSLEITRMIQDINLLKKEYEYKETHKP